MPEADLMKLMAGGAEGGAPGGASAGGAGPTGSAMTTPQENEGAQAEAQTKIALALDLLEQALPPYGSESEEGSAILGSITSLTKKFGIKRDAAKKMIPAELKMLMEAAGQKSPEMQGAAQAGGQPGAAPMLKAA